MFAGLLPDVDDAPAERDEEVKENSPLPKFR